MDDVLVGRVTISAGLKKINFPKISEQAPLSSLHMLTVVLMLVVLIQKCCAYNCKLRMH